MVTRYSTLILMFGFLFVFWLLTGHASIAQNGTTYYVSRSGNDDNPGTFDQPWQTIDVGVMRLRAGDTLMIRGGTYPTIYEGWAFHHSGTPDRPITVTNYDSEQVILQINDSSEDYQAFACWGLDYKADHVRIIGTNVAPVALENGVISDKGIVILGPDLINRGQHTVSAGIIVRDCDYWEIAGIDFVDVGYGIFTLKDYSDPVNLVSTTHWHVHDNRVHGFYAESGMQFNGDHNLIERNLIYKIHDEHFTPWGCQHINLLGYGNMVRGNVLSEQGSADFCFGVTLEWDMADENVIEQNEIYDADAAVLFLGGDNNIIRNNLMVMSVESNIFIGGITILSTDSSTVNYCNSEPPEIIPPDDPSHPEYAHYYMPRNCHSYGNRVVNNTVYGYYEGIRLYDLVPASTEIKNNIITEYQRGAICPYDLISGTCKPLPDYLTTAANRISGDMGFVDAGGFDFSLADDSALIDAGVDLRGLVDNDLNGVQRPLGDGYDIGAYEFDPDALPPAFAQTLIREVELLAMLRENAAPEIDVFMLDLTGDGILIYYRMDGITGTAGVVFDGQERIITIQLRDVRQINGLSPPQAHRDKLHRLMMPALVSTMDGLLARYMPEHSRFETLRFDDDYLQLISSSY